MSCGTTIEETPENIAAAIDADRDRLMPLLANLPTEQADMVNTMNRAKEYALGIDLELYSKTYCRADEPMNAIKVSAGGSHSNIGDKVVCASYRLDVSPSRKV